MAREGGRLGGLMSLRTVQPSPGVPTLADGYVEQLIQDGPEQSLPSLIDWQARPKTVLVRTYWFIFKSP